MTSIDKLAQSAYNKKAYAKNKITHNEICRKYYIINSEILRQKRIERYYIQKAAKLESPEYKLKLEAKKELKKEIKRQKLLKKIQELDVK
jgi:hypothetical protein